jgi:hypothetical protein
MNEYGHGILTFTTQGSPFLTFPFPLPTILRAKSNPGLAGGHISTERGHADGVDGISHLTHDHGVESCGLAGLVEWIDHDGWVNG